MIYENMCMKVNLFRRCFEFIWKWNWVWNLLLLDSPGLWGHSWPHALWCLEMDLCSANLTKTRFLDVLTSLEEPFVADWLPESLSDGLSNCLIKSVIPLWSVIHQPFIKYLTTFIKCLKTFIKCLKTFIKTFIHQDIHEMSRRHLSNLSYSASSSWFSDIDTIGSYPGLQFCS